MSIRFDGINDLLKSFDELDNIDNLEAAMNLACLTVEGSAKQKIKKGSTGNLAKAMSHKVENDGDTINGIVFNTLDYAPYVEYGTGAYRENNAVQGYWVYVRNSDGSVKNTTTQRYTKEEAKQIVAMMRADGLDATYTDGRQPQPFMRPALDENREEILRIIKESLLND